MSDKKEIARQLYLTQGKTQKEIALEVGVSERTVYTWVHQFGWHMLKRAAYEAPATISDNLSSQLVEMQNVIAAREPGKRYPTPQEADVMRKIILSIQAMKKTTSLSQNVQMMECFRHYVRPLNTEFSRQLAHYADRFLNAKSVNGYAPYQMEYGVDIAPVAPFYDELDGSTPIDKNEAPPDYIPCKDVDSCNKKDCNFPDCYITPLIKDDRGASRKEDIPWAPLPARHIPAPATPEAAPPNPQKSPETIDGKGV